MSVTSACRSIQTQDPTDLLAQRPAASSKGEFVATLRQSLRRYEERFGIPSEHLDAALKSGELGEDLDVCDWLIHYSLLLRAEVWRLDDCAVSAAA